MHGVYKDLGRIIPATLDQFLHSHEIETHSSTLSLSDTLTSFQKLDVDADGCISIDDVRQFMFKIRLHFSESEIQKFHSKLGFGCICFDDYIRVISRDD